MRPTRTVFAAFVLFVVAASGGDAYAGDGSNLLQYLPPTASVVVGIDVDAVRSTPFWTTLMDVADDDSGVQGSLETLQNDASFDPRTATHTLVLAANEIGANANDHAVVLFEVDYPREGLTNVLVADQYEAGTVGEIAYYRKGQSTVAFLGDNIVAMGNYDKVLPAMNVAAGQGSAGVTGAVAAQLGAVDRSKGVWIAAALPTSDQGAQAGRASIDFSNGLGLGLTFLMVSAERAAEAVEELRTQITTTSAQPEVETLGLSTVLQAVQVSSADADLTLNVSVDAATWTSVLGNLTEIAKEELR